MQGWRLFRHSVLIVWRNFGYALRLSLVPAAAFLFAVWLWRDGPEGFAGAYAMVQAGETPWFSWFTALTIFATGLWFAVSWHRFVLLDERAVLLPPPREKLVLTYLGRVLQTVLVVLPLLAALAGAASLMAGPYDETRSLVETAIYLCLGVPVYVVLLRLAPLLPATALDRATGLRAAWRETEGANGAILVVTVITFALTFAVEAVLLRVFAEPSAVGMLAYLATEWLYALINVSILTTIYGHYVEGRPID